MGNKVHRHLLLFAIVFSLGIASHTQTFNNSEDFIPGVSYLDSTQYVEYLAGNLPIVISVPHGGNLKPSNIPDRDCSGCVYVKDLNTQELARTIQEEIFKETGCYPHIIINLLSRTKFDANRDIADATDGNPTVERAWHSYHNFIDISKSAIIEKYGRGIFLDLHGHGHDIQRIELGYQLSKSTLQSSDRLLNSISYRSESSIQTLVNDNRQGLKHVDLLKGNFSFGSMLASQGYPAVPSFEIPFPQDDDPYFSGGYNTKRHGSTDGGPIDGIQVECNRNIRGTPSDRLGFARGFMLAIFNYVDYQYFDGFLEDYCEIITSTNLIEKRSFIKTYPNPVSDFFIVESNLTELDLDMFNFLGQKVYSVKWLGSEVDIGYLPEGLYLLRISHRGEELEYRKILKK